MSRQKKIDRMDVIELDKDRPVRVYRSTGALSRAIFEAQGLVIGYDLNLWQANRPAVGTRSWYIPWLVPMVSAKQPSSKAFWPDTGPFRKT